MSNGTRLASRVRRCVATAGVLALAAMALALPAPADVINHERFGDSFSDDFELCGIPVHTDGEVSGFFHQRVGKGDRDTAFFAHINYTTAETITNPANGKFLVIEGHAVVQQTTATRLEGTIFEFSDVTAGQPFVLRDMSGAVVLRNRGAVRGTILFDTLGDDTPGGVVLEVISVRISGPHPELEMDEDAFCAVVQNLIG
jgi:hypothetical protein